MMRGRIIFISNNKHYNHTLQKQQCPTVLNWHSRNTYTTVLRIVSMNPATFFAVYNTESDK